MESNPPTKDEARYGDFSLKNMQFLFIAHFGTCALWYLCIKEQYALNSASQIPHVWGKFRYMWASLDVKRRLTPPFPYITQEEVGHNIE